MLYPLSIRKRSNNKYDAVLCIATALYEQVYLRNSDITFVDNMGAILYTLKPDYSSKRRFFESACVTMGDTDLLEGLSNVVAGGVSYCVQYDLVTQDLLECCEHYHLGNTKVEKCDVISPFNDGARSAYLALVTDNVIHLPAVVNFDKAVVMDTDNGRMCIPYAFIEQEEVKQKVDNGTLVLPKCEPIEEERIIRFYYNGVLVNPYLGQVVKLVDGKHLDVRCMWSIILMDMLLCTTNLSENRNVLQKCLAEFGTKLVQNEDGRLAVRIDDEDITTEGNCVVVKPLLNIFTTHYEKLYESKIMRVFNLLKVYKSESPETALELGVSWKGKYYDFAVSHFTNSLNHNASCAVLSAAQCLYREGVKIGLFPKQYSDWWFAYCFMAIVTTMLIDDDGNLSKKGLAIATTVDGIHQCNLSGINSKFGGSLYGSGMNGDNRVWCCERVPVSGDALQHGAIYVVKLIDSQHYVLGEYNDGQFVLIYDPYVNSEKRKVGDTVACDLDKTFQFKPRIAQLDEEIATLHNHTFSRSDVELRLNPFEGGYKA